MACSKLPSEYRRLDKYYRNLVQEKLDIGQLRDDIQYACAPNIQLLRQKQEIEALLTAELRDIHFDSKQSDGRTVRIRKYQEAIVLTFGSTRSNVGTSESDLDTCVLLQAGQEKDTREEKRSVLYDIRTALRKREAKRIKGDDVKGVQFTQMYIIPRNEPKNLLKRRPPPILKLHTEGGLTVDICVEDVDGPIVSELIRTVKARGGRIFHAMLVALKLIGAKFGVLNSVDRFPSATNLFFLLLYFLQTREKEIFGPVNIRAITFSDDRQMLKNKLHAKGGFPRLDQEFEEQATHGGWREDAMRSLDQTGMTSGDVLPVNTDLDLRIQGQTKEQTLKQLLVGFCQWLGNPDSLPAVVDVGHPKKHLAESEVCAFGRPCLVILAPVHSKYLEGPELSKFRFAFKNVGEALAKSEIILPVAPKSGAPKLTKNERIAQAKLRENAGQ